MKRKAMIFMLFAVASVIWGTITVKIIKVAEYDNVPIAKNVVVDENKTDIKYLLNLDYKDPFCNKKEAIQVKTELDIKHADKNVYSIECCGKFTKDKTSYYSIKINGRFYTLKFGEAADGLRLISRRNDTLKFIGDDNSYYYSSINDAHGNRNFQHYK